MIQDLGGLMFSVPAALALGGARQAVAFLDTFSRALAGEAADSGNLSAKSRFRRDGGRLGDMAGLERRDHISEPIGSLPMARTAITDDLRTRRPSTLPLLDPQQRPVLEQSLQRYRDGDWHVFEQVTRKPFQRLKGDATRALLQGLSGLVTLHQWNGTRLEVSSIGSEATLDYKPGRLICRVKFRSFPSTISFVQSKILSDVESAIREVSGASDVFNKNVFIAHGRDHRPKLELKEFLLSLGLNPIILEEEHDMGMTVPEKLEYYASLCSFAFVIVTPDDLIAPAKAGLVASSGGTEAFHWRPRQNVIMELGWFMAHLSLDRVAILYKEGTEIPSDLHGILYVRFEESVLEVSASERIRKRLEGVYLID